ncbi:MAG: hypothetical protein ABIG61_13850 [Planctomycetota bacterium]
MGSESGIRIHGLLLKKKALGKKEMAKEQELRASRGELCGKSGRELGVLGEFLRGVMLVFGLISRFGE